MTDKEIIKGLQAVNEHIGKHFNEGSAWMTEFIDNAIKLLEQQPITWIVGKDNCQVVVRNMPIDKDCISREAVIRLVEQYPNIIGNRCSGLIADIKHLPSVTPSYNSIKTELKPCEDCVSREAVLNLFRPSEELQDSTLSKHWFDFVSKYINKLPSVQLQKKKGKWIVTEDDLDGVNFPSFSCECSECGADFSWKTDFCPGCGAEMESEDKE